MTSERTPAIEPPTPEAIGAVLAFLPYFADRRNTFYEDDASSSLFDSYDYAPEVDRFQHVLYESGFLALAFNWIDWQDTAEEYVVHPDRLADADLTTLRKLLLTHVRKERFASGHLAAMIECGHILAILQRLEALQRGGDTPDTIRAT